MLSTEYLPRCSNRIDSELFGTRWPVGGVGEHSFTTCIDHSGALATELMVDRGASGLPDSPSVGAVVRCGGRNHQSRRLSPTPVIVIAVPRSRSGFLLVPLVRQARLDALIAVRIVAVRTVGISQGIGSRSCRVDSPDIIGRDHSFCIETIVDGHRSTSQNSLCIGIVGHSCQRGNGREHEYQSFHRDRG